MKTSQAGIDIIKQFEGCRLTAYLDRIADPPVWTIGFGCTGPGIRQGLTITRDDADQMLADRLAQEFEPGVLAALEGAPVSQPQFDAMVSLAWNIGVPAFKASSVARYHRAGNYPAAADAFKRWIMAGGKVIDGLVRRREEERALYLSGSAATTDAPPETDPIIAAMKQVQSGLRDAGLYRAAVDGIWGPLTQAAWATYLEQRGL